MSDDRSRHSNAIELCSSARRPHCRPVKGQLRGHDICFFFCEVKNCSRGLKRHEINIVRLAAGPAASDTGCPVAPGGAIPLNNWPAPRQLRRSQIQAQQRAANPKLQLPGSATPDSLVFVPITPCRLADTRTGSGYAALGSTPLATLTSRNLV